MRVGEKGFAALAGPFDRNPQLARRVQHQPLLGIEEQLHAETAAHVGRHHAETVLRQLEDVGGQQPADAVRTLGRGGEGETPVARVVGSHRAARFHRIGDQAVVDQGQLDHVLGLGETRLGGLAVAALPVEAEIAGDFVPHQRLSRIIGGCGYRRSMQDFVIDRDQLGRVLGLGQGSGDDESDAVADMPRLAFRQQRMLDQHDAAAVAVLQRHDAGDAADAVLLQIGGGVHAKDSWCLRRRRRVDSADAGMGVRRPQHVSHGLARKRHVVGIAAVTGDESRILGAAHRLTHAELSHAEEALSWKGWTAKIEAGKCFDQSVLCRKHNKGRIFGSKIHS